ncbi:MAG: glycosyltransferase family 2 protein [Actinomycetota bacterium]|nr:glycosyltransferase family 2 protein [Actinomycetota bacterium]
MNPELSVVIPMYNEGEVLPLLVDRLRPTLEATGSTYEVVAVDDGSTDLTPALLQRLLREWDAVRVVRLRANAGHQAAISAGLVSARGDYVVTIDADLQDPPEVIGEMLTRAKDDGLDVVYGVRCDRSTDTVFKRVSARAFYSVIRRLSATDAQSDAGDFRLMSRATVEAITVLPEHNRVLRFIVPALGFPSGTVEYRREERAAGVSKYPLLKMIKLSVDSVTGFSMAPLRLATLLGIGGGILAVLLGIFAVIENAAGKAVAGWTSTVVIVAAVGAAQLLCLGLLGEYIGRMYTQMQGRPTYFIAYDSLRASDGRRGPTDTPLPPVRRAAGAPVVARTPDARPQPAAVAPSAPATGAPTGPVMSSAPLASDDQQAHTGELLDR